MLVIHKDLVSHSIRTSVNVFEVIAAHRHSIWTHEFNVPGNPFNRIQFVKNREATSSDHLDLVVSLLIYEPLEEQPDVVHLLNSV